MGWQYRKSIRLMPGVRLNVGKRGFSSVSLGRPGYTVNLNGRGAKHTFGLPGSGLSYSTDRRSGNGSAGGLVGLALLAFISFVFWGAFSGPQPPPAASRISAEKYLEEASAPVSNTPAPAAPQEPVEETAPKNDAPLVAAPQPVAAPSPDAERVVVQVFANVRAQPSRAGDVLGQVEVGDELSIVERSGPWVHVRRGATVLGWVHRNMLAQNGAADAATRRPLR